MTSDFLDFPIDSDSSEALHSDGLRLGLVNTTDTAAFDAWLFAESRGFHEPQAPPELISEQRAGLAHRRSTGVWDDTALDAGVPVATVSSWPTELTVPGEMRLPAWAISAVTVSPTHRRRGIARALVQSELRNAQKQGMPLAMLTVSEATIYGRFGFAPAAMSADLSIDAGRAGWMPPPAPGRVQFVTAERLYDEGMAVMQRARGAIPGSVEMHSFLWKHKLGLIGEKVSARELRFIRYEDADGTPQGFAIYKVSDNGPHHAAQGLDLQYLVSVTDDAYAELWRFLLQLDLVGTVKAPLRSVDEPLAWQVADSRAVTTTERRDHLWVRILDVKAALEARRFSAPGRMLLDVRDPLGFADGPILLDIDDEGKATVTPAPTEATADVASLSLTVNELGALYLGGVSAVTLVRAGRITERRAGSAVLADASFRSSVSPWQSFWF